MKYRVSIELWLEKFHELEEWRARNRKVNAVNEYRRILDTVGISSGSKILDIGCADGTMKRCLPDDVDYYGIDPFPKAEVPYIRKGMAESIPFESETFDYVICFATLFHLQDLELAFKEMARVLKSSGMLLVLVILRRQDEPPSKSHTFRITHEMMDRLWALANLKLAWKREVKELGSWFYGWKK